MANILDNAAVSLGLPPGTFRTHGCRRGGASELALQGMPRVEMKDAGRWAFDTSCNLYIRKGEVLLLRLRSQVSHRQWGRIILIASIGEQVCHLQLA